MFTISIIPRLLHPGHKISLVSFLCFIVIRLNANKISTLVLYSFKLFLVLSSFPLCVKDKFFKSMLIFSENFWREDIMSLSKGSIINLALKYIIFILFFF